LLHHDANEALMQGSVEVTLPDGTVRMFNVHENNGRPYDPAVKDPDLQARFWYFREVPGILGVEQIPLRPRAAVAGDVWNLGLGKVVALDWPTPSGPELRLAVLADTGGAFEPNLFQLDWLAGTFPDRAAWQRASEGDPKHVGASVLVRRRADP
jgi:membrane-bound lytic murein transglycosylase